jgi:hypothetical protein
MHKLAWPVWLVSKAWLAWLAWPAWRARRVWLACLALLRLLLLLLLLLLRLLRLLLRLLRRRSKFSPAFGQEKPASGLAFFFLFSENAVQRSRQANPSSWVAMPHANIADRERLVAVDDRDVHIDTIITGRGERSVRQQYWPTKAPRTGKGTSDVIGVFMRDQHGIDVFDRQTEPFQPTRHLARTKFGIDQQESIAGFHQQGVAPATAAE